MPLAESTVKSMREKLGAHHPFILSCAVTMANCLHDLEQLEGAESLQRDTGRATSADFLGGQHPDTLVCEATLAVALRASRRTEEAALLHSRGSVSHPWQVTAEKPSGNSGIGASSPVNEAAGGSGPGRQARSRVMPPSRASTGRGHSPARPCSPVCPPSSRYRCARLHPDISPSRRRR